MPNTVTNFISFILPLDRRIGLAKILPNLYLEPPYDLVVQTMCDINSDLTKSDIVAIMSGVLDQSHIKILSDMPDVVSLVVGNQAMTELMNLKKLQDISVLLKSNTKANHKIQSIIDTVQSNMVQLETRAKKSTSLLGHELVDTLFKLKYDVARGDFALLCAYTGIGKTNICFGVVRQVCEAGLRPLIVIIGDWSESRVYSKINKANNFPQFYVALYYDCGVSNIESEIEAVKPDVLIVDSLTNIHTPEFQDKRYLQLGWVGAQMKRLALKYDIGVLATHQLTYWNLKPTVDDLQDGKSHLLKEVDIGIGVGGLLGQSERNTTTLKLRHTEMVEDGKLWIDYTNLVVKE